MWRKLFLLLIAGEIIIVLTIYRYSNLLEAATQNIRPTSDGSILGWTVLTTDPGGSHWSALDDDVTSFLGIPDITDTISVLAVGKDGAEEDQLSFVLPKTFESFKSLIVWIYGNNALCIGGGAKKGDDGCDTLTVGPIVSGKKLPSTTITPSVGLYAWHKVSLDMDTLIKQLSGAGTVNLGISLTRNGVGNTLKPGNNDNITIAAIYLELTTSVDQGGTDTEVKSPEVQPAKTGATEMKGGAPSEKNVLIETQKSAGSIVGGGENSE